MSFPTARLVDAKLLYARGLAQMRGRSTPLLYSGSAVATSLAQLVAAFFTVKWILPADLGLWQSTRLAQTYAFMLLFGINNGLSRELPFFLGKGDRPFCDRLAGSALFYTHLATAAILVGGVGCAIALGAHGIQWVYAILAMTVLIPVAFYQNYFIVSYRSKDSFNRLTMIQFAEGALSLATIPMIYLFRYEGMLLRTVLISGVVVWLMYEYRPLAAVAKVDWSATKLLLKTGLPIFALDYAKNITSTLDRLVLLYFGGVENVGYYALALMVFQTLQVVPRSLGQYVYPRMTYKFGQHGDARMLWKFGLGFAFLAVGITGLAGVCGWVVLPRVVPMFAPKYLSGLRAAQIILIAGIAEGIPLVASALLSIKAWKVMVAYQTGSSILGALGPLIGVVAIGRSLEGVAWGVVMAALGRAMLALIMTYRATHKSVCHIRGNGN